MFTSCLPVALACEADDQPRGLTGPGQTIGGAILFSRNSHTTTRVLLSSCYQSRLSNSHASDSPALAGMPGAGTRRYSAAESTCTATGVRPCRQIGSRERFVVQVSGMEVVLSRVQTIRPVSGARIHAPPAPTARWGVLHFTNASGTNSCSRGTGASRADRCLTSDGLGNTQYKQLVVRRRSA
jgi:hypothetical protein